MTVIDLRSDTVTQPTDPMRRAMADALVGDDVMGEDPSINRLQEMAAEKVGKAAGLYVPSGTMANLVAVLTHCGRGDEIIVGDRSHIFINEVAGISALGGVHSRQIPNQEDGTLSLNDLEQAIRPDDIHYPPTRMIGIENTHNYCHGTPLTVEYMSELRSLADRHQLAVHLDGARLFNASEALSCSPAALAKDADSVMFCLSKGLSAPVGSILLGNKSFITRARKIRKMLGGGMRQAGHLAAAGVVALEQQLDQLKTDHENARMLAEGLSTIPGIEIDLDRVSTNIIFFGLEPGPIPPRELLSALSSQSIKMFMISPTQLRAVTHRHITPEHIEKVVSTIRNLLK